MSELGRRRRAAGAALGGAALMVATACGTDAAGGGSGELIVLGTNQAVTSLDPASTWETGSWDAIRGFNQQLLVITPTSAVPKPDAASSCDWQAGGNTVYTCTLRKGLKFSNGHTLSSSDVVFSINRMQKIKNPNGPWPLLDTMKSVKASGSRKVTFTLKSTDTTFPLKLSTSAAAIVDEQVYPADRPLARTDKPVGSGLYQVEKVEFDKKKAIKTLRMVPNKNYRGAEELKNDGVTLKIYTTPADGLKALQGGRVDAVKSLGATEIDKLRKRQSDSDAPKLYSASVASNHSLVLDVKDKVIGRLPVRQALAYLVDRKKIASEVHQGTVDPLYSMIPLGLTGHGTAFNDRYGDVPDVAEARKVLTRAGITQPVAFTVTYPTGRPEMLREAQELERQLEQGGLFEVTMADVAWEKFIAERNKNKYAVSINTWFADLPDPDNFIGPLLVQGAFAGRYRNAEISDRLLPRTQKENDRAETIEDFLRIERIAAREVPMIPLTQGKDYMTAEPDILGVQWTLDTSGITRYWNFERETN
jgi:peptide/nickel transport system substrate-binding protein